jgi:hypothetical protein
MIDHGFVFNGPNWDFTESPLQGLYPRKMVYEKVRSLDDFQPCLEQVIHFPEEIVDKAFREIPPEWLETEEDQFEQLLARPASTPSPTGRRGQTIVFRGLPSSHRQLTPPPESPPPRAPPWRAPA